MQNTKARWVMLAILYAVSVGSTATGTQAASAMAGRSLSEIGSVRGAVIKPLSQSGDPTTKALFDAINASNLARVKRLLKAHPKLLNSRNWFGETPLIYAVRSDAIHNDKTIALFILSLNPNVNSRDKSGVTALEQAQFFHENDIVSILIKHGAKK